jgi:hypothetical protein
MASHSVAPAQQQCHISVHTRVRTTDNLHGQTAKPLQPPRKHPCWLSPNMLALKPAARRAEPATHDARRQQQQHTQDYHTAREDDMDQKERQALAATTPAPTPAVMQHACPQASSTKGGLSSSTRCTQTRQQHSGLPHSTRGLHSPTRGRTTCRLPEGTGCAGCRGCQAYQAGPPCIERQDVCGLASQQNE